MAYAIDKTAPRRSTWVLWLVLAVGVIAWGLFILEPQWFILPNFTPYNLKP